MPENFREIVTRSYETPPKYSEIKAGVPEDYADIKTLGDLLSINYKPVTAKQQIRKNLISQISSNSQKYPGIVGYDDDVIPAVDRALLSCHDVFLIGQIGQAKTKLVETIAKNLLSPMPIIKGSMTNDCPMDLPSDNLIDLLEDNEYDSKQPKFYVSPESSQIIREKKLETKIEWIDGKSRYRYVLATPDISVKDLVGFIDAVKVAKRGVEMYKIESYSPGQLMQSKHGIFCLDELPVLDPRKQVALLSVLQEGRFTTGAFPVIFEPHISFFATANPIDYTHSGKIIEPLADRLKSHIHTHYPTKLEDEIEIILQEANIPNSFVPYLIIKVLASVIQKARKSELINQERGVSVRLGIHGLELLIGEAERIRSIKHHSIPVPRLSDFSSLNQIAKFELSEIEDTVQNRYKVFDSIIDETVKETALSYLGDVKNDVFESIKSEFAGNSFEVSSQMVWINGQISYNNQLGHFPHLRTLLETKLSQVLSEQETLKKFLSKSDLSIDNIQFSKDAENEVKSVLLELLLEGLCWTDPKVLDKKETNYVSAQ